MVDAKLRCLSQVLEQQVPLRVPDGVHEQAPHILEADLLHCVGQPQQVLLEATAVAEGVHLLVEVQALDLGEDHLCGSTVVAVGPQEQ